MSVENSVQYDFSTDTRQRILQAEHLEFLLDNVINLKEIYTNGKNNHRGQDGNDDGPDTLAKIHPLRPHDGDSGVSLDLIREKTAA
jgi:hypothetical protein